MTIRRMTVGLLCVCATSLAWARTGTLSVEKDGEAFNVTFADHVHETNGLWVVYGAADKGSSTNGWENVEFLQPVYPETESVTYSAPAGWGDTVKTIRFILSEVPYEVDYTLAYLQNNMKNRICLDDFDFYGTYRVVTKMRRVSYSNGSPAFFSTRAGCTSTAAAPYFTLFEVNGSSWRFDYNSSTGTGVSTPKIGDNADYLIDASYAALKVNDTAVASHKGTFTSAKMKGQLEFFCANYTAGTMGNQNHVLRLYSAQIYDCLDSEGKVKAEQTLLVNLIPAVKDGAVGVYDTVRKNFYANDTGAANDFTEQPDTRIESADPFFASASYRAQTEGPTVFAPVTYTEDGESHTNAYGGIQNGDNVGLKLSGFNDWGGKFAVSNGILKAGFGQGLGANDNLVLNGVNGAASYAGWDGLVTNTVGMGPGQIWPVASANVYLQFAALDGDLTINLGGKADPEPFVPTSEIMRLSFNNHALDLGTIRFLNPITPPAGQNILFRNRVGETYLEGGFTGPSDATGGQISGYGAEQNVQGTLYMMGTNSYKSFYNYSGGYAFGPGSTNMLGGKIVVQKGAFTLTNAYTQLTGEAKTDSQLTFQGGKVSVFGGETIAGGMIVGKDEAQSATEDERARVTVQGKMTLKSGISSSGYGSVYVYSSSHSAALTFEEGADVTLANLLFQSRNIYHKGGKVHLTGGTGIARMGKSSTARYNLAGGRLEAPFAVQADPAEEGCVANPRAIFLFAGGTLANTVKSAVFFQNFGANSSVEVSGRWGGTFEVNYDTSITNAITQSGMGNYPNTWNFTTKDYLTAPAFTKTGPKTLTLTSDGNEWNCATDVAEGTLKLAAGAALPSPTNVVRLTGGTLDLGGNSQPLKALCGTAGEVKNGSVTVSEGIYPGGAGTIGSFTCNAALAGTLFIDVDATGAADSILTTTALDLSNIDLVITAPATAPAVPRRLKIVNGPYAGTFKSVSGLPSEWTLRYSDSRVSIGPDRGTVLLFR